MPAFQKALDSFRTAAAAKLGVKPDDVTVLPGSEDVVGFDDVKTGALVGFMGNAPSGQIRGMASGNGDVVVGWKGQLEGGENLAKEAKLLDAAASLSAGDSAKRIVWVLGVDYSLIEATPPSLERQGGGATLRFDMTMAGDTGVVLTFEATLEVASDYSVTWSAQRK